MRHWLCATFVLLGSCATPPALIRSLEELQLIQEIEAAFGRSVDAEKSTVLAQTGEESSAFAGESTAAASEVDRDLARLRELIDIDDVPRQLEKLETVEKAWAELREVDAGLLAVAVTDTNRKATQLSSGEALRTVDRVVDALASLAKDRGDPDQTLSAASVSALRIQTLQPLHIASADGAEMDALEVRMRAASDGVDRVFVELQADPRETADTVRSAAGDWAEYKRMVAEVIRLSLENSDIRSFQLSLGVKRQVTARFRSALAALAAEIRSSSRPGTK
jgi:UDP-N-acetylmuramyl tripeptide synthase